MSSTVKLPPRWRTTAPIADGLVGEKFLAFKTPLDRNFQGDLEGMEFNVMSVFQYLEEKKLEMGLWIDLSIPKRFNEDTIEAQGCQYLKIPVQRKLMPDKELNKLHNIIQQFIKANPNKIIGVHCTHGHNRTGFLIVSYLVEICNWELERAIAKFQEVRPPGIYREYVFNRLRAKYGSNYGQSTSTSMPGSFTLNQIKGGMVQDVNKCKQRTKEVEKEKNWREHRNGPNMYFKKFGNAKQKPKKNPAHKP